MLTMKPKSNSPEGAPQARVAPARERRRSEAANTPYAALIEHMFAQIDHNLDAAEQRTARLMPLNA